MTKYQKAFILLKADPGHERKVLDDLMKIDEVTAVHIVPGEWDLLAEVVVDKELIVPSDQKVYSVVLDRVGKIKHIRDTNTMVTQFSKSK